MSTSLTPALKLQQPGFADRNWHLALNANAATLDGLGPVAGLAVATAEVPSASLNVSVAGGYYLKSDGTVGSYAGAASHAVASGQATYLWLDGSGALQSSTSGFPTTPRIPLAVVAAGTSSITSVADARVAFAVCGTASASLPLAGGTMTDGANIAVGSTAGTKLATAASQKLGLWGATPIVQPSGSAQAALTDSTTGTVSTTVANVGTSFSQSTLNGNFATILNLLNKIRADLVAAGAIKGSA